MRDMIYINVAKSILIASLIYAFVIFPLEKRKEIRLHIDQMSHATIAFYKD